MKIARIRTCTSFFIIFEDCIISIEQQFKLFIIN